MSEPNARDYEHARNIVCDENIEGLARAFAAYREETEAKKTVPMEMLCSIAIACVHYELNRDYPWSQDDLRTIAARYGYEVTE